MSEQTVEYTATNHGSVAVESVRAAAGLAGTLLAAQLPVTNAAAIVTEFGVPQLVIGAPPPQAPVNSCTASLMPALPLELAARVCAQQVCRSGIAVASNDLPYLPRPELSAMLRAVDDDETRGAVLLGPPGAGKTTLLVMLGRVLVDQGRTMLSASLSGLADIGTIGSRIADAISRSNIRDDVLARPRTGHTSAGGPPISEIIDILHLASDRVSKPILILDGLDENQIPSRVISVVEELALRLTEWRIVVASRSILKPELRYRLQNFTFISIGDLSTWEASAIVHRYAPGASDSDIERITRIAGGNALLLNLLAGQLGNFGTASSLPKPATPREAIEFIIRASINQSEDPEGIDGLLVQIALSGGAMDIKTIAPKIDRTAEQTSALIRSVEQLGLLHRGRNDTAVLLHDLVRYIIISRLICAHPFRPADLNFGSEEAERDDLLDKSFVQQGNTKAILTQRQSLIIGDRGSGKSAIFRKLPTATSDHRHIATISVSNAGELLHRVVDKDSWQDVDALRAAWLVIIAAMAGRSVTKSAPKHIRRDAANLQAALGLSPPVGRMRRALRVIARPLAGTTMKFSIGPVNLEAKLPIGTDGNLRKATVDIGTFLQRAETLLKEKGEELLIVFDRIDEAFKYDRPKQEAIVQSLLQAEGYISLLTKIRLAIFLRTDLFELYDIQEKNKLVSRTLVLDWSEEDWLRVVVKRTLANPPLGELAKKLRGSDGSIGSREAFAIIFPPEIEGQPIDRWLVDSLKNGNGDLSPRLAVLLLHLTCKMSPDDRIATIPIFTEGAACEAMTRVSELSFSEVVNDFKVASSFVLNCRAGKLDEFTLPEVEDLFDTSEGTMSEQIRLLERLGFLERVVQITESGTRSLFKIPRLYTRCWDRS
ncbi:hypothetical protein GZH49_36435 [Nocardia terpenica]|uniref:P-loop ATPase, Sll1717 family n=1 Tax=Nocardia terpenica TaxID=455432 RepID=UPI002FDF4B47